MPKFEGRFIPPNLTTAERDAITSPVLSEIIYNTTVKKMQNWDGVAWVNISVSFGDTYAANKLLNC